MFKCMVMLYFALVATSTGQQHDIYHDLHLPHDPPLYPVFAQPPPTQFSCSGRTIGYYADVQSGCQAFHFCWHRRVISTELCTNGTLFNEQFQVCDHFYNVRCGSPYEDL
ncbi:hypothetical protein RR46_12564 [Papilio xuthus]|uniref:Chitin-binding type-2 domain-containing protein n=1 Tax=Papilio xuthus TaxID=66420 RepID=A0A194PUV9_PAPXU|nr:hypothetical protein RR46_12564 [Papilio xuthus]